MINEETATITTSKYSQIVINAVAHLLTVISARYRDKRFEVRESVATFESVTQQTAVLRDSFVDASQPLLQMTAVLASDIRSKIRWEYSRHEQTPREL
jgi:hypothetical protein